MPWDTPSARRLASCHLRAAELQEGRMQVDPGHILVVDDDALNRRLLKKSLEETGHRTTDVDNGFAALTALEADQPDLVLLDIMMPGLDGMEVLSRMKENPALVHIPVIMISGVEDAESI